MTPKDDNNTSDSLRLSDKPLSVMLMERAAFDERLDANAKYAYEFEFAVHDKIQLIGQTSALLSVVQERCAQLQRIRPLLEACAKVVEAWDNYDAAIRGRAESGEYEEPDLIDCQGAIAKGHDLDELYFNATDSLSELRKLLQGDGE